MNMQAITIKKKKYDQSVTHFYAQIRSDTICFWWRWMCAAWSQRMGKSLCQPIPQRALVTHPQISLALLWRLRQLFWLSQSTDGVQFFGAAWKCCEICSSIYPSTINRIYVKSTIILTSKFIILFGWDILIEYWNRKRFRSKPAWYPSPCLCQTFRVRLSGGGMVGFASFGRDRGKLLVAGRRVALGFKTGRLHYWPEILFDSLSQLEEELSGARWWWGFVIQPKEYKHKRQWMHQHPRRDLWFGKQESMS